MATSWTIVGQGLAGSCLAWQLWKREVPFRIIEREEGGSSRVAAGLINPVTGKNFQPSRDIAKLLPQAIEFYKQLETKLDTGFWHPLPILRLADDDKQWAKMQDKATLPEIAQWIAEGPTPMVGSDWIGRLVLHSGGRLDTQTFLDASRAFFTEQGCYNKGEVRVDDAPANTVWCEGAIGLMKNRYGPHRCAKGEILTLEAKDWQENAIRVGAGGWLIPLGKKQFRVGATYEWDELDESPTEQGRKKLEAFAAQLGGPEFRVINHEAGIRPILRRSQPLIGPIDSDQWMFNALGSKGSLYAPGIAAQLADWLVDGKEPDAHYDYRNFNP